MKKSRTALTHVDTPTAYLKERPSLHRLDQLCCVAEVIRGILQAESTLHRKIVFHINRAATTYSSTQMVAWVFYDAGLSQQDVQDILLPRLPPERAEHGGQNRPIERALSTFQALKQLSQRARYGRQTPGWYTRHTGDADAALKIVREFVQREGVQ